MAFMIAQTNKSRAEQEKNMLFSTLLPPDQFQNQYLTQMLAPIQNQFVFPASVPVQQNHHPTQLEQKHTCQEQNNQKLENIQKEIEQILQIPQEPYQPREIYLNQCCELIFQVVKQSRQQQFEQISQNHEQTVEEFRDYLIEELEHLKCLNTIIGLCDQS